MLDLMSQFHFDPDTYMDLMRAEVPDYDRLQDAVAAAVAEPGLPRPVRRILDLGTGTGVTAKRVLTVHPEAALVGIDENELMLAAAHRSLLVEVDLRVGFLQDPLPDGPFDLVVSALAVHHLDGPEKADLFRRIAKLLTPGGRFVLADVVLPLDPAEAVIPLEEGYDKPSTIADQLTWLTAAGFEARIAWVRKDLAVLTSTLREQ